MNIIRALWKRMVREFDAERFWRLREKCEKSGKSRLIYIYIYIVNFFQSTGHLFRSGRILRDGLPFPMGSPGSIFPLEPA